MIDRKRQGRMVVSWRPLATAVILLTACNPSPAITVQPTEGPGANLPAAGTPPPTAPPPSPRLTQATPTPTEAAFAGMSPGEIVGVTEIYMADMSRGWAIGGREGRPDRILRTSDGGEHWQDVTPPEPAIVEFAATAGGFFLNAEYAWAVYDTGYAPAHPLAVWRTSDGGTSWSAGAPLPRSGDEEYMSPSEVEFIDEMQGWLLVDVGAGAGHAYIDLFRTSDGGATWGRVLDPYSPESADVHVGSSARSMDFADARTGVISIGVSPYSSPRLNLTRDGGVTWRSVPLEPPAAEPSLFDQAFCGAYWPSIFAETEAVVVVECSGPDTTSRYLYATRDGGLTWEVYPYPGGGLLMLDPRIGFSLGADVYRTGDGGETWTRVSTVPWEGERSFADEQAGWPVPWRGQYSFVDERYAWAVGRSGDDIFLFKTADGGRTWEQLGPTIGE